MERRSTVGLTRDAGWQIGVSITVAATPEQVWALLVGAGLRVWLGETAGGLPAEVGATGTTADGGRFEIRSYRELDRIRLRWSPPDSRSESTLQVTLREVRPGRTTLRFHQEQLPDSAARGRQRVHWESVRDELVAQLRGREDSAALR